MLGMRYRMRFKKNPYGSRLKVWAHLKNGSYSTSHTVPYCTTHTVKFNVKIFQTWNPIGFPSCILVLMKPTIFPYILKYKSYCGQFNVQVSKFYQKYPLKVVNDQKLSYYPEMCVRSIEFTNVNLTCPNTGSVFRQSLQTFDQVYSFNN